MHVALLKLHLLKAVNVDYNFHSVYVFRIFDRNGVNNVTYHNKKI